MMGFETASERTATTPAPNAPLVDESYVHVPYLPRDLVARGRPDPTALLPWMDDDLREPAREPRVELPGQQAIEAGHQADSWFSTGEGLIGALEGVVEEGSALEKLHHVMHSVSPYMAILGGGLGAINLGSGIAHMQLAARRGDLTGSEGSQGALDAASGLAGIANLVGLAATGSVCAPLAIAAGVAGLASAGNEYAEHNGWYGEHRNQKTGRLENATFLNSIGDGAGRGWRWGHHVLGNGRLGDVLGGIGAGVDGGYHGVYNTGAAVMGAMSSVLDAAGWHDVHPRSPEWMSHPLGIDAMNLAATAKR